MMHDAYERLVAQDTTLATPVRNPPSNAGVWNFTSHNVPHTINLADFLCFSCSRFSLLFQYQFHPESDRSFAWSRHCCILPNLTRTWRNSTSTLPNSTSTSNQKGSAHPASSRMRPNLYQKPLRDWAPRSQESHGAQHSSSSEQLDWDLRLPGSVLHPQSCRWTQPLYPLNFRVRPTPFQAQVAI